MTLHAMSAIQSTEGFRCDHATHGYFLAPLVGRLLGVESTKTPSMIAKNSPGKIAGDYCEQLTDLDDKVVEES